MSLLTTMQFIVNIIIMVVLLSVVIIGLIWLFKDKGQDQHSVLRNFPVLGRIRYISEKSVLNYVNISSLMIMKENHFQEMIINTLCLQVNITLE